MSAETFVAASTGILAVATFALAGLTYRLERAWKESAAQQIGLQTWLHFQARFDSNEMKRCRKKLAQQLDPYDPAKHDEVEEELFDLFEDLGTVYGLNLLNKKLADSTFSFYVNHWWKAAKPYVDRERTVHGDDETFFEEFETLAKACRHHDPQIDHTALKNFLEEEKRLRVDFSS
jgi:hypothetical protein